MPSYLPVMQYADSRRLRAAMYRAYATRAAEFGRRTRQHAADPEDPRTAPRRSAMLGYANFAEVSLVPKMAESVPQVLDFLRDLAVKARPFAEQDIADLRAFAAQRTQLERMEAWDVGYVSEKLLQARYAFSEQEVKQYFTEDKVLGGLFTVIETLFGVRLKPDSAPVWHEDVRFFRIETPAGELIGQFYLDLYARETKRGGAWMDEAISRRLRRGSLASDGIQKPVAYLNCNFSRPVGVKDGRLRPATFTHDDVITLFHETGHGLHHLLTRSMNSASPASTASSGTPSNCRRSSWRTTAGSGASAGDERHVDTGEPLPRELFDKMLAAKNFQSGMQTLRQVEFSLFDLLLHSDFDPPASAACSTCWPRCGAKWRFSSRPNGIASRTASRTSSPAVTAPATTATSGPRSSRPIATALSKRPATPSTGRPANAS
jgi:oligopeptidase A